MKMKKRVSVILAALSMVLVGISVTAPMEAEASGLSWCNAVAARVNGPFTGYVPSRGENGSRYCQMSEGSVSDAVGSLQATLTYCHSASTKGIDFNWGPNTTLSVKAIQWSKGIAIDGVYGPQTHNAIGKWFSVHPSWLSRMPASTRCVSDTPL